MEHRISATDLARNLGDVLARVRYRNDSYVVERNGDAVARLTPLATASPTTVGEAFRVWQATGGPDDPDLADDLERIGALDRPPDDPWES
ncbi:MAG: type II toxin-antitoxin system prevent-host-death family antitoxin [Gaiellales bacterium]